jgi:hypothetical protein
METPEATPVLTTKDIIFRQGLMGGGAAVLLLAVFYIINTDLLMNLTLGFIPLAIILIFGIFASLNRRKNQDGYISYGESVFTGLGSFGISMIILSLFNILLYRIIDPSLTVKIKNMTLDRLEESYHAGKIPKNVYQMQIDNISNPSIAAIILQIFFQIVGLAIIGFIFYLIASIFIKNDSPFKSKPV